MNYQRLFIHVVWLAFVIFPFQIDVQAQPLQVVTPTRATQPTVDGVIDPQEWSDAAELQGTLQQVRQAADARPVTFWVKTDGRNVYVAMRSAVRKREWNRQGPITWFDQGDSSFVIGLAPGRINHGDEPSRYLLRVNLHDQKIAWELTPQIKGVKLSYPHLPWHHQAVIKHRFNDDRSVWYMEAAIPLATMNVNEIALGETWGLMLARDYAAADPTAIVLSDDWRFGDGRGRIYGRAFYNHYRKQAQWAQLRFEDTSKPSVVQIGAGHSTSQTPDVPDFAMLPFQKGGGLLVSNAEMSQYGVYTNTARQSKNTTATGYEPISNEFYAKLNIATLPEVARATASDIVIRRLGTEQPVVTHVISDLKPEQTLRLGSTHLGPARSTVIEWVAPSDGEVDVHYEARQDNSNRSDGLGFQLVHVDTQAARSNVLIERRNAAYADGWLALVVNKLAVKAGDKVQFFQDKWGHEANDIGRLRGSLNFTDKQGRQTIYSPAAEFASKQGGTSGVWFYRYDDDVTPNVDGIYPALLWQRHPHGFKGWMWFDGNEEKLNPWQGNEDRNAGRAWASIRLEQDHVEVVERFKLPELAPGVYEVQANIYADADRLIGQARQLFIRFDHEKDLPWLGHDLGVSHKVLPPWTPMTTRQSQDGESLLVSCWGRTHQVNRGGLFGQIQASSSSGVEPSVGELLASPVRIEMVRDGRTITMQPAGDVRQTQASDASVAWEGTVEADGWQVQINVDMSYDGYGLHKLVITPPHTGAKVDRLRLVIPLESEQATHLHAAAGAWFRAAVSSIALDAGQGVLWHSGRSHGMNNETYRDNWGYLMAAGDFKPYVWLGGAHRGLAFMADNDRGWVPDDSGKNHSIEVVRDEHGCNLILNLVARPFAFDHPRTIDLSLQATPVRPLETDFRARLSQLQMQTAFPGIDPDGWDWNGSRFRIHDNNVVDGHGSQPYPLNWDRNISKREEWEKRDIIFTPYQSQLNIMSFAEVDDPRMPAGKQVSDVYGYLFPHFSAGALEHGNLSITKPDLEYRLWCYHAWIHNAGIKGLYFDQTEPSLGANPAAGAGYILDLHDRPKLHGTVQPGYLLTNAREFYKRLYTMFLEAGVQKPMIWMHTTDATMISAFAFAGAFLEGENSPKLTPDQPWISEKFDASRIQAVSNPAKLGVGAVWLSMFEGDWRWPQQKQKQYMAMRSVQGYAMLHDYAPDWGFMRWGNLELTAPATFYPYWDSKVKQAIATNDPDVFVSVYKQNGQLHLVAFNYSKVRKPHAKVNIDLGALGLDKPAQSWVAQDLHGWGDKHDGHLLEEPMIWQPKDNGGELTLDIHPHDYRLILLTQP